MKIKNFLAYLANHSDLIDAYATFRRFLTKSQVAILVYHRVAPKTDDWLLGALDPKIFDNQLNYICNKYRILSLEDLVFHVREKKTLPNKAIVITFDDGYKDNFVYAYPILKKYSIPATIFLTTGCIDTGNFFWWDKLGYVIKHCDAKQVNLDRLGTYSILSEIEKFRAQSEIIKKLEKFSESDKTNLLNDLISILKVKIPPNLGEDIVLSWNEIRKMNNNGITFGAHTVNHPILTNMPLENAKWEIIQSKKDIEDNLGIEVTAFAYPNGYYNREIIEFIMASGFTCAVSYFPKLMSHKESLYELGRIEENKDSNILDVKISGLWGDLKTLANTIY
jgi:peptidoglycan/xylan/chitin deacetylase (PgdA/CDA1 family)